MKGIILNTIIFLFIVKNIFLFNLLVPSQYANDNFIIQKKIFKLSKAISYFFFTFKYKSQIKTLLSCGRFNIFLSNQQMSIYF